MLPPPPSAAGVPPPPSIQRASIFPSLECTPGALSNTDFTPPASKLVFSLPDAQKEATDYLILDSPSDFCPIPSGSIKATPEALVPTPADDIVIGGLGIKAIQLTAWAQLAAKFDEKCLRMHQWEWVSHPNDRSSGSYLPYYTFQPVLALADIWTEWALGRNGYLPVRAMEEHWAAKWRRDQNGLKTEWGRCKLVIQLIERLAAKPNWNLDLALRFIRVTYEDDGKKKIAIRKFCESLQKKKNTPPGAMSPIDKIVDSCTIPPL